MSSLFNAMNISDTGLTAQSVAMSNISNNIANAQTTGFKSDDTLFADLVNQSSTVGANAGNGAGVIASSIGNVSTQGTISAANSSTDMAISGDGFFNVEKGQVTPAGTVNFTGGTLYTRRGDFSLSAQGYLVNGTGNYLEGYPVDQTTGAVNSAALTPIQISQLPSAPVATTTATLNANLPANAPTGTALAPTAFQVFDATGSAHNVQVTWTPNGSGQWTAQVNIPDATGGFNNSLNLAFGAGAGVNAGTIQSISNSSGSAFTVPTGAAAAAGQPATASFTVDFGSGPQTIALNLGTFNQAVGLTQFADSSQQVSVTSLTQNGTPPASFQSVSVDQSGNVNVNYSNGQSKIVYQVPLARFVEPNQLRAASGEVYSETADSGRPMLSAPNSDGAGAIQSGSLENSNVDLTGEFTKMIQTQQIYSANSRAVTTANAMLADLLSIIHP